MSITIDQAGRLVIPKSIRDRFNLVPGSKLEVDASGDEIRLWVAGMTPSLLRVNGVLVHHGATAHKSDLDIVDFLRSERQKTSLAAGEEEAP